MIKEYLYKKENGLLCSQKKKALKEKFLTLVRLLLGIKY